jgi:hypothetical protein
LIDDEVAEAQNIAANIYSVVNAVATERSWNPDDLALSMWFTGVLRRV